VRSARNVFRALDPKKYEVVPIAITKGGTWLLCRTDQGHFPAVTSISGSQCVLLPGGGGRCLVMPHDKDSSVSEEITVDMIFPVLHGPFGEDGTIQAAARLADVPYIGSDVLGSAIAMDKDVAKRLLRDAELPITRFHLFTNPQHPSFDTIIRDLGSPVFVKPARLGSSVGVSKAETAEQFDNAVKEAFRHDKKILVEAYVSGREVECGVLENDDGSVFVSVPGEIVPGNSHKFYTYEAKYLDERTQLKIPADLSASVTEQVRQLSAQAFRALECEGLARIDFFICPDDRVLVNEVNTLPGFTEISMYPKILEASGVAYSEQIDRLIAHALRRASGHLPHHVCTATACVR